MFDVFARSHFATGNNKKGNKKMSNIIDKVEYRTSKNGKKGKKAILVRINGKWELLAKANISAFKDIEGDLTEDAARCGVWEIMRYFGIEIPEGITKARNEAYDRICAAEEKRALRKCSVYDKGVEAFTASETAKIASRWEKLSDFVTAYRVAKAYAETAAEIVTNETAEADAEADAE